jgi:hypothetical protein
MRDEDGGRPSAGGGPELETMAEAAGKRERRWAPARGGARGGRRRDGDRTGPARPSDAPKALREAAEAAVRQNAEALRKAALPIDAEPAFVFKP